MTLELNNKEYEALRDLIKTEMVETKDLINNTTGADNQELSDYYNILYTIQQKLVKKVA